MNRACAHKIGRREIFDLRTPINRTVANIIQLIDDKGRRLVKSFNTYKDCAKYLVSIQTIPNRISNNSQFIFKDKLCTRREIFDLRTPIKKGEFTR